MKKENSRGISRTQHRKLRNLTFAEAEGEQNQPQKDITSFILNENICNKIADYIVQFRMTSCRSLITSKKVKFNTSKETKLTFWDSERIGNAGRKLNLTDREIDKLKKISEQLVDYLVADQQLNTQWAIHYLTDLYRNTLENGYLQLIGSYTYNSPFQQMYVLNSWVLHAARRRIRKTSKTARAYHADISDTEALSMQAFLEHERTFFGYMPSDWIPKTERHHFIQIGMLWVLIVVCSLLIVYKISSSIIFDFEHEDNDPILNGVCIGTIDFVLAVGLYFIGTTMNHCGLEIGFLRSPFGLKRMSEGLRKGLFVEIGKGLDAILPRSASAEIDAGDGDVKLQKKKMGETKKIPETQQSDKQARNTQLEDTGGKNWDQTYGGSARRPKKLKQKRQGEAKEFGLGFSAQTLLGNAGLKPPLCLTWETRHYGTIQVITDQTTKDIYELWSLVPTINAFCKHCFIYWPIDTLKAEAKTDAGLLDEYTGLLAIGHVVPPTGKAGIVQDKEEQDCLKAKLLSVAQGTKVEGNPGQHRYSFFRAKFPKDLREEPPCVAGHEYQIFLPERQVTQSHT